jgi:hypothetical protein
MVHEHEREDVRVAPATADHEILEFKSLKSHRFLSMSIAHRPAALHTTTPKTLRAIATPTLANTISCGERTS